MSSAHTPGPWRLQEGHLTSYVVNDDGRSLARIVWGTEPFVVKAEEAKANGHLMAAAPELLEALRKVWAHSDQFNTDHGITRTPEMQRMYLDAMRVIAKAEIE